MYMYMYTIDQPSPDEGGGGGAHGGPIGGGGGPGSQPAPPQPLFHPDDINVQSLAGLTPHLQINPQVHLHVHSCIYIHVYIDALYDVQIVHEILRIHQVTLCCLQCA